MDYYSSVEALPINQSLVSIGANEKSVQPLPSKKLNDEITQMNNFLVSLDPPDNLDDVSRQNISLQSINPKSHSSLH